MQGAGATYLVAGTSVFDMRERARPVWALTLLKEIVAGFALGVATNHPRQPVGGLGPLLVFVGFVGSAGLVGLLFGLVRLLSRRVRCGLLVVDVWSVALLSPNARLLRGDDFVDLARKQLLSGAPSRKQRRKRRSRRISVLESNSGP